MLHKAIDPLHESASEAIHPNMERAALHDGPLHPLRPVHAKRRGRPETRDERHGLAVLDLSRDCMAFIRPDYTIAFVNSAFGRLHRMRREEFTGLPIAAVMGRDLFASEIKPSFDRAVRGETVSTSCWLDFPGVGRLFMETCYTPSIENGRLQGVVAIFHDATERMRTEQALKAGEERYRSLMERIPDIVWTMDGSLRCTYCSPSVTQLLGYETSELLELEPQDWLSPSSLELLRGRTGRSRPGDAVATGAHTVELELTCKDGAAVSVEAALTLTCDEKGRCVELLGVARDITERRRKERQKDYAERIIRHDLKTPLTGVITMPDLLLSSETLTDKERSVLRLIQHSGKKMLRLIEAGQSLHALESGTYRCVPHEVDLCRELFRIRAELADSCNRKNLAMHITIGGVPATLSSRTPLDGDPTLLPFLFSNLVQNAVEASPEGGEISIEMTLGDDVTVAIHNSGAVPREVRDSLFRKFATHGKTTGTGLGAYSARLVARAHGGDVTMATSEADDHTTLTVTLPARHDPPVFQE